MKQFPLRIWLYFAVTASSLWCVSCIFPSLIQRATTPFQVEDRNGYPFVTNIIDRKACGTVERRDVVLRWRGESVAVPEALEFLSDISSIGDTVLVTYQRADKIEESSVTLVPFYPSLRFVIITYFVGLGIWGVGVYVLWYGWRDLAGRVLHWMMICFASVVMVTWGAAFPTIIERVRSSMHFFRVVRSRHSDVLFFHDALSETKVRITTACYASLHSFPRWQCWPDRCTSISALCTTIRSHRSPGFNLSMTSFISLSLFISAEGYSTSSIRTWLRRRPEERRRTKWILWGFVVGAIPFLFLYILPQLLFSKYLIDEEYTTIAYLVIPFAFAVSFIKYRLFDIEVIINRSIVYSVLTLFIGAAYVVIVLFPHFHHWRAGGV